jgi:hypothetical protein
MTFGKIKIGSTLFMSLIFIIGFVITIASFKIASTVVDCSLNAQNAVRGLLVMGTALICIPVTILAFNCSLPLQSGKESMMSNIFVLLLFLINSSIIGLCSVIHNECENARQYTQFLIPISVLATVCSAGYLGYEGYTKFAKGKGKSKSVGKSGDKSFELFNLKQKLPETPGTPSPSPSPSPSASESSLPIRGG